MQLAQLALAGVLPHPVLRGGYFHHANPAQALATNTQAQTKLRLQPPFASLVQHIHSATAAVPSAAAAVMAALRLQLKLLCFGVLHFPQDFSPSSSQHLSICQAAPGAPSTHHHHPLHAQAALAPEGAPKPPQQPSTFPCHPSPPVGAGPEPLPWFKWPMALPQPCKHPSITLLVLAAA